MSRRKSPKPNKRLFFEVGHGGGNDPGAIAYNGRTELSYNIEVVSGIIDVMKKLMDAEYAVDFPCHGGIFGVPEGYNTDLPLLVDSQDWSLQKVINEVNKVSAPEDFLLSVHFNYNNPKATGTEIFVNKHTAKENKERAAKIVTIVGNTLDIRVRNSINRFPYKYENETAVKTLGILRLTRPQAALLEVCFLNAYDLAKYEENKHIMFNTLGKFLFDEIFKRND